MKVDGIWRMEIFGLYGWESIGVLVLTDGDVVGGGNHHYAVGSYEQADDQLRITLSLNYRDVPRTLFGEARNQFTAIFEGTPSVEEQPISGLDLSAGQTRDERRLSSQETSGPPVAGTGSIRAKVNSP